MAGKRRSDRRALAGGTTNQDFTKLLRELVLAPNLASIPHWQRHRRLSLPSDGLRRQRLSHALGISLSEPAQPCTEGPLVPTPPPASNGDAIGHSAKARPSRPRRHSLAGASAVGIFDATVDTEVRDTSMGLSWPADGTTIVRDAVSGVSQLIGGTGGRRRTLPPILAKLSNNMLASAQDKRLSNSPPALAPPSGLDHNLNLPVSTTVTGRPPTGPSCFDRFTPQAPGSVNSGLKRRSNVHVARNSGRSTGSAGDTGSGFSVADLLSCSNESDSESDASLMSFRVGVPGVGSQRQVAA